MNFLAHAIFTDGPDDVLFGAVVGDMLKGQNEYLPKDVQSGLKLHNDLDIFFDKKLPFARSRSALHAIVRHYHNIVLDICCDHILASRWNLLYAGELDHYTKKIYDVLSPRISLLPQEGQEAAKKIIVSDRLTSYATIHGLEAALNRTSHRVGNGHLIRDGMDAIFHTLPFIEVDLVRALPALRYHTSDSLDQLGYRPEGRIVWKNNPPLREKPSRGIER